MNFLQSILSVAFVTLLAPGTLFAQSTAAVSTPPLQPVTFCRPNNMVSALLYIAEAQGYFGEEGLMPTFETTTNAKLCQDTLIARKADYMSGAEGPFTYLAPSNPPLSILTMLQRNPETAVFARADHGIRNMADLRGKRIGYLPGTVSYFFLGRALHANHIVRSEVNLTAMQPPTMPQALIGGAVDAIVVWEPWGSRAITQLGDKGITLSAPSLYQYEALLTGHKDAIAAHPDIPPKIIRALIKAEKFLHSRNADAFELLSKLIAFDRPTFTRLWPLYEHRVQLTDRPIRLMEENFALLKEDDDNFKNLPTPNFRSFIDPRFLLEVDSARVQLPSPHP